MNVRELLDTFAGIEEAVVLYQGKRGRPRARRMLSEIEDTQRRLYNLFTLKLCAPKDSVRCYNRTADIPSTDLRPQHCVTG